MHITRMKSHVQNLGRNMLWDKGLPAAGYWRVCQIWVAKGSLSSGPDVRSAHSVRTVDGIEKLSLQHRMNYPPRGIQNRQTYGRIDSNF